MHASLFVASLVASATGVSASRGPIMRRPHGMTGSASYNSLFGRDSKSCSITTQSCHNTTAISDLCCFNAPGGALLQTQFWDGGSSSTGPTDSWTIHGLWPDNCDGTYESNCDTSRAYTDISGILQDAGKDDLLDYMNTYWKNDDGTDEEFWEHEWSKHGTCISTFDTSCYTNYQQYEEAVDFFQKVVDLFKTLNSYQFLSTAGITPSSSKTYTKSAISAALKAGFGQDVYFDCDGTALNQIWYYYNVKGSVQDGTFVPIAPVGSTTNACPSSGITYPPKTGSGSTTATTTATERSVERAT